MKLDKIISLANKKSELRFLAMVRSLRAVGCELPVWVIPYDDEKFELPDNCIWWEINGVIDWLNRSNANKMMRKYQCLLTDNYQYVDSDIIFLRNPEEILKDFSGFITSCGQWRSPPETYVESTLKLYKAETTGWQKNVFNAGQFACDKILYDFAGLKNIAEDPAYKDVCLNSFSFDQVALNLLVFLSGIPVTNMTLTSDMESTWAGDYDDNYEQYWVDSAKKPYIIHWAGCNRDITRPVDQLFLNYLASGERQELIEQLKKTGKTSVYKKLRRKLSLLSRALKQAWRA